MYVAASLIGHRSVCTMPNRQNTVFQLPHSRVGRCDVPKVKTVQSLCIVFNTKQYIDIKKQIITIIITLKNILPPLIKLYNFYLFRCPSQPL